MPHSGWFWADFWRSPHVRFIDLISYSTVWRQVATTTLGGVTLGMLSCSLLKSCPIQFQGSFVTMLSMLSCWHLFNRSSFVILLGQNIRQIHLRLIVDICHLLSFSSILHHRVARTQLWYNFCLGAILLRLPYVVKHFESIPGFVDSVLSPHCVHPHHILQYSQDTNSFVVNRVSPFTWTGNGSEMFSAITFWFISRPTWCFLLHVLTSVWDQS